MDLVPDDKDWTWATTEVCADCGFDPADYSPAAVASSVRALAGRFVGFLAEPDAAVRPRPHQWSALEYSAHVSDVLELFERRLAMMLAAGDDGARFENWDQDAAALERGYSSMEPSEVARTLMANAERAAHRFGAVGPLDLGRRGIRSNGSEFTIATFAPYFAHDLVHHIADVERGNEALRSS